MLDTKPNGFEPLLLLREMTHRVINEYSSAISLLSLAASRATNSDVKAALKAAADSLDNYVRVHRALQMPAAADAVDLSDYLYKLCQAIYRSRLHERGISLKLAGDRIVVTGEQCWYVGLIISELVTNATKHAFDKRAGSIRVELLLEDGQVYCRIMDDGTAATGHPPGRGSEIIRALAALLGGKIVRAFSAYGTTATLTFPLEQIPVGRSSGPDLLLKSVLVQ